MSEKKQFSANSIKKICFCALFAALICVSTFISVPLPFGYFNLGDIMILLCAWSLSPIAGAIASAAGAGLADLLMGYTLYVPATVVIKALMSVCAFFVFRLMRVASPSGARDLLSRIVSALCAEAIMIAGYFSYEYILYGGGAFASVLGNLLQGTCAVLGASALGRIFRTRVGDKLFSKR